VNQKCGNVTCHLAAINEDKALTKNLHQFKEYGLQKNTQTFFTEKKWKREKLDKIWGT